MSNIEIEKKRCTGECGKLLPVTDFHMTSRKYTSGDSGHELVYVYRHAKCKECRRQNERIRKKNKKIVAQQSSKDKRLQQPFSEFVEEVVG